MGSVDQVKRLEDWMTFEEAGIELGYSKQGIHRLIFESASNPFDVENDVRGVGERPLMLIRKTAVMAVKERLDPDAKSGRSKIRPLPTQDGE